jgi:hypothetical protein
VTVCLVSVGAFGQCPCVGVAVSVDNVASPDVYVYIQFSDHRISLSQLSNSGVCIPGLCVQVSTVLRL